MVNVGSDIENCCPWPHVGVDAGLQLLTVFFGAVFKVGGDAIDDAAQSIKSIYNVGPNTSAVVGAKASAC